MLETGNASGLFQIGAAVEARTVAVDARVGKERVVFHVGLVLTACWGGDTGLGRRLDRAFIDLDER